MRLHPASTILGLGIVGVAIDRLLKSMAMAGLTYGPVDGGVRFELFPNPAIAFSLALPTVWTITLIPIVLTGFFWYAIRQSRVGRQWPAAAGWLVILAAGSNLFDRLRYGYVVDYFSFGDWLPVFNVSDWLIMIGLLFIFGYRGEAGRRAANTSGVQLPARD